VWFTARNVNAKSVRSRAKEKIWRPECVILLPLSAWITVDTSANACPFELRFDEIGGRQIPQTFAWENADWFIVCFYSSMEGRRFRVSEKAIVTHHIR
jgi:hypothetical protein